MKRQTSTPPQQQQQRSTDVSHNDDIGNRGDSGDDSDVVHFTTQGAQNLDGHHQDELPHQQQQPQQRRRAQQQQQHQQQLPPEMAAFMQMLMQGQQQQSGQRQQQQQQMPNMDIASLFSTLGNVMQHQRQQQPHTQTKPSGKQLIKHNSTKPILLLTISPHYYSSLAWHSCSSPMASYTLRL